MNWAETIALLQQAGYTQPQIAAECGCAQPTISDLATGKTGEPRHSVGQALLRLESRARRRIARMGKPHPKAQHQPHGKQQRVGEQGDSIIFSGE